MIINQETVNYVMTYLESLMTDNERKAKRGVAMKKPFRLMSASQSQMKKFKEQGWLTDDPDVAELLKHGYEEFELATTKRILNDNNHQTILNNCPRCGQLTRTPKARQCRHCGHDWHDEL
mgnify:FL=1